MSEFPSWLVTAAKRMRPDDFRKDPVKWSRERLDAHLWSKQREIAEALVHHRKVAVPSGHDMGKSYLASMLSCWWIDTHPLGEALAVTTAPSAEQVHSILWEEIREHHRKYGLPGIVQRSDRWILDDGRLVGLGRKPPDHAQSAFQGLHRRFVLAVLDEAGGIAPWMWDAVESITTNEDCRILAIGNPDDNTAEFEKVCRPGSGWHVIQLNAMDSPNVTGEWIPEYLKGLLVAPSWIEDKRQRWGENSAIYKAKVLGEFADKEDALIPLSWIVQAQNRWRRHFDETDKYNARTRGPAIWACDVARFGSDRTAMCERVGDVVFEIERFPAQDTMETADELEQRVKDSQGVGAPRAIVDVIGVGAGVVDKLRKDHFHVQAFNASHGTKRRDMTGTLGFKNLRSAAWWNMRELLDPINNPTLCLPPDDELAADLSAPTWREMGGKIIIQSKDELRKHLGRSTDSGDTVVMSCWTDFPKANARGGTVKGPFYPEQTQHASNRERYDGEKRVPARAPRGVKYKNRPGGW